jgi:hypothetical protein
MSTRPPSALPGTRTTASPAPPWPPAGLGRRAGAIASIGLVLLLVAACARPLAVPERELTLRVKLPLTAATREAVVLFIAAGGRRVDGGGTLVQPPSAVEGEFGALLDALRDTATLRFDGIASRVRTLIPSAEREAPVIDATEEFPDEVGRVGFLLRNFWFVFYAQKETEAGPLPASEWRVDRLAIFRDRPPT